MNVGQRKSRRIAILCSLLGYSRQAYHQHLKVEQKKVFNEEKIIQQVFLQRKKQPKVGGRKLLVHLEGFLQSQELTIGRDAFFKILSKYDLLIRRKRYRPRTTQSDHWMFKYPNEIVGFIPTEAHQLWVSDITYLFLKQGHGYLSLITDAYSRKVVGYHISEDLTADGPCTALQMAIRQLPAYSQVIHHSDRGCQYCCAQYVQLLQSRGICISMTQGGDPRDNAIAERINGILKNELLEQCYPTFASAAKAVASAIRVYNHQRLHSSIGMHTPAHAHRLKGQLRRMWKNYYPKHRNSEDIQLSESQPQSGLNYFCKADLVLTNKV